MCEGTSSEPAPSRFAHVLNGGLCIEQYISQKHSDWEAPLEVNLLSAGPMQRLDQVAKSLVQ